jgi:hypothetical protein
MDLTPVTLCGRRVTLEPIDPRHAPDLFEVMQDEEVCRYLAWPPPVRIEETLGLIGEGQTLMARAVARVCSDLERDGPRHRVDPAPRRAPGRPSGRDRGYLPRATLLADRCQHRGQVPLSPVLLRARRTESAPIGAPVERRRPRPCAALVGPVRKVARFPGRSPSSLDRPVEHRGLGPLRLVRRRDPTRSGHGPPREQGPRLDVAPRQC